jgi:hypothetical protein
MIMGRWRSVGAFVFLEKCMIARLDPTGYSFSRTGFTRKGSFETKRKYHPEDDLDKVIDSEMKRIRAVVK